MSNISQSNTETPVETIADQKESYANHALAGLGTLLDMKVDLSPEEISNTVTANFSKKQTAENLFDAEVAVLTADNVPETDESGTTITAGDSDELASEEFSMEESKGDHSASTNAGHFTDHVYEPSENTYLTTVIPDNPVLSAVFKSQGGSEETNTSAEVASLQHKQEPINKQNKPAGGVDNSGSTKSENKQKPTRGENRISTPVDELGFMVPTEKANKKGKKQKQKEAAKPNENKTKPAANVNQFSAEPKTPVEKRQVNLDKLVKNGVGSLVDHSKPKTRVAELLSRATSTFKNSVPKVHVNKETGIDGVDFINTASNSDTELGRALDINHHIRFQWQDLGWFSSVGAIWFYIISETREESYRNLHGVACRNIRDKIVPRRLDGFRLMIADATWSKISSNKNFAAALVKNKLPYVCFYKKNNGTEVVDSTIAFWYMPVLEEIARTLKAIDETGDTTLVPNFDFVEKLYDPKVRKTKAGE